MAVTNCAATALPTASTSGPGRRGGAWAADEPDGFDALVETFKTDTQQRISLMELMSRIRATGISPDDPGFARLWPIHPARSGAMAAA
jgi:hypothetical protein